MNGHLLCKTTDLLLLGAGLLVANACAVYDDSLLASPSIDAESDAPSEGATEQPDSRAPDGEGLDAELADGEKDERGDTSALDSARPGDAMDEADASWGAEGSTCQADSACSTCDVACQPSCTDGVMNGDETGIDCGGSCATTMCGNGTSCSEGTRCKSGYCRAGVCTADLAVHLSGDQAMSFRRPVADDFTFEMWIRCTESIMGTQWWSGAFLLQADTSGTSNDFGTSILNGRFAFGTGNPDATVLSNTVVTSGTWTHVAASRVRGSGTLTVFVNGLHEKSVTSSNTSSLTASNTTFIGSQMLTRPGYIGDIDEVRVWNVARTASEIAANMKKRLVGNESNLVAYWRMDEPTGFKFSDSSPSRNDATWLNNTEPPRLPGAPLNPSP